MAPHVRACAHTVQVTGVQQRPSAPLHVVPCWQFDAIKRKVQLVRLAAVCGPVAAVKQLLQRKVQPGSPDFQQVRRWVCTVHACAPVCVCVRAHTRANVCV